MNTCCHCGVPAYGNWCTWKCHVEAVKADGGEEHLPNGLPVACIKHDGSMLEHEHGDHSDYMFPIVAISGIEDEHETHALIYTDGNIAVTVYECCYTLWSLTTGFCLGGHSKGCFLEEPSRRKIIDWCEKNGREYIA